MWSDLMVTFHTPSRLLCTDLVGGVAVAGRPRRRHHGHDLGRRSREGRRRRRHVRLLDARAQLLELDPPAN